MAKDIREFSSTTEMALYAKTDPDATVTCAFCTDGCDRCGGEPVPAWIYDPEITGPYE